MPRAVGLDVGTRTLKLVELSGSPKAFKIQRFLVRTLPEGTGEEADALSSDQASLGMVWDATDSARVTFNGYYLDLDGGSTNYGHVPGPTDYVDNIRLNVTGRQDFTYSGANANQDYSLKLSW